MMQSCASAAKLRGGGPILELLPTGLGRSGLAEVGGFCFDGRLFCGSPIMPKALSIDLRERVIAAIEAGASCRQAAERFGVGAATAIRWQARLRQEGEIAARPMGGDRCSHRIEAHAAVIVQACEAQPQAYLRELRDTLRQQGVSTSISGLHRFFGGCPEPC
jgi:transposase